MAVKVGNSWVTEEAYDYAKKSMNTAGKTAMQRLEKKFEDTKFSTKTAAFQAKGTKNIAIAPSILREMEKDPDKRMEYEALIYDCVNVQKTITGKYAVGGKQLTAQGFIIDARGKLSSWSISEDERGSERSRCRLPKREPGTWFKLMFNSQDFY